MDCPRCNLNMIHAEYENESVMCCQACWGYWLTRTKLDNILRKVIYKFDVSEQKQVLQNFVSSKARQLQNMQKDDVIKCPKCLFAMIKRKYEEEWPIIIDECSDHGIWLDTGEIKALQIYMEKAMEEGKISTSSISNEDLRIFMKSVEARLSRIEKKLGL